MKLKDVFFAVSLICLFPFYAFADTTEENGWNITVNESPLDDKKQIYIQRPAEKPGQFGQTDSFEFRCQDNEISALISIASTVLPFQTGYEYEIQYRIDKEPAVKTTVLRGEGSFKVFFFNASEKFLEQLSGKKTLVVQYPSVKGKTLDEFNIEGIEKYVDQVKNVCRAKK